MTPFQEAENRWQGEFKLNSGYFSEATRDDGVYIPSLKYSKPKPVPYCLPVTCAEETLFPEIREAALAYFREYGIEWHDKVSGFRPSNHLRDSQVCCVNCLFPFSSRPEALVALLRHIFPDIRRVFPFEGDHCVAFEWIGLENYLNDSLPGLPRKRGKGCTSSDAAVLFEREGDRREIALLNWKYAEAYDGRPLHVSPAGRDRVPIYRPFFQQADGSLDQTLVGNFEDLFYDPFDQLIRLQFLAREMERARELGAERVTLVNIAPAANPDILTVTAPGLRALGSTVPEIWHRLVRPADRSVTITTEELFRAFPLEHWPDLRPWWAYVTGRYRWLKPSESKPATAGTEERR